MKALLNNCLLYLKEVLHVMVWHFFCYDPLRQREEKFYIIVRKMGSFHRKKLMLHLLV